MHVWQQGEFFLESSYRFFNEAQSLPLQQSVLALARAFQLTVKTVVGYPGWQPDMDSPLLAQARALHERLFGTAPAVKAIHAGLECGILKGKKPDLDILSFGPTIRGAHSPTERLQIDTVEPFWRFLKELLTQYLNHWSIHYAASTCNNSPPTPSSVSPPPVAPTPILTRSTWPSAFI